MAEEIYSEEIQENNKNKIRSNNQILNLDSVPSSQPELGPSIPDGGYGWIIFIANLFFQVLIPSLIVNFGVFIAFTRLEYGNASNKDQSLWDYEIVKIPLFYMIFKTLLDTPARKLVTSTIYPRLVATSGICLTCAGLLFLWIGMTTDDGHWIFSWAGILTGIGAALLLTQSEILVGQYFRLKLPILTQISHIFAALGFILSPMILGNEILKSQLPTVLLWYQAIVIQGLILTLFYRLPPYLKNKQHQKSYRFLSLSTGEDEEDIFSKNAKELQIKRQNSETVHKIDIEQPGTSKDGGNWVKFEDEREEPSNNHRRKELSFSDDDEFEKNKNQAKWERFGSDEDLETFEQVNQKSLSDEMSEQDQPPSLFPRLPINNNNTYSFDDEVGAAERHQTSVFAPNNNSSTIRESFKKKMSPFKEPTFYKALLTSIANKFSVFVFFSLFPSYLYVEAKNLKMNKMSELVGLMAVGPIAFYAISYFMKISRKNAALFVSLYNLISFVGYLLIADNDNYPAILFGGVQVAFSTFALDYYGKFLFGPTLKGEFNDEYALLSSLSGFSLFVFLFLDVTYKTCFRLMAVFQFFVGVLWLSNFAYNKIRTVT